MVSEKPHEQSVTGEPCECGFLRRMAAEPGAPIAFDAELQEYQLRWPGAEGDSGPIYHCPFCGGAAPRSLRASLFAELTMAEVQRLCELTKGLTTVQEAIAKLGAPQEDRPEGIIIQTPSTESEPSRAASYRTLTFGLLSEVADVTLIDYGVHGIKFSFGAKYVGAIPSGPTRG